MRPAVEYRVDSVSSPQPAGAVNLQPIGIQFDSHLVAAGQFAVVAVCQCVGDGLPDRIDGYLGNILCSSTFGYSPNAQIANDYCYRIIDDRRNGPLEDRAVEHSLIADNHVLTATWIPREADHQLRKELLRESSERKEATKSWCSGSAVENADALKSLGLRVCAVECSWSIRPESLDCALDQVRIEVVNVRCGDGFAVGGAGFRQRGKLEHRICVEPMIALPDAHIGSALLTLRRDKARFLRSRELLYLGDHHGAAVYFHLFGGHDRDRCEGPVGLFALPEPSRVGELVEYRSCVEALSRGESTLLVKAEDQWQSEVDSQ